MLSALFLFSCRTEIENAPDHLIQKNEMASILADLFVVEGFISAVNINEDSSKVLYDHYKSSILSERNINPPLYDSSFMYYQNNVYLMDQVSQLVLDSINFRQVQHKLFLDPERGKKATD